MFVDEATLDLDCPCRSSGPFDHGHNIVYLEFPDPSLALVFVLQSNDIFILPSRAGMQIMTDIVYTCILELYS